MKKILYIIAILICNYSYCQTNLVPNPSFENVTNCPNNFSELDLAIPWSQAGTGTPDLYAPCSASNSVGIPVNLYGNQLAHTGAKYSGLQCMCAEYREYIEVPLTSSLTTGVKYFVSFFVSLADTFAFTSSSLGAYLSTNSLSVSHYSVIPVIPQVQNPSNNYFTKNTWHKVTGSFYASGGESFITIGNFNSPTNTTIMAVESNTMIYNPNCVYFYIDDVCVTVDSSYSETWTNIKKQMSNKSNIIKLFPNPVSNELFVYMDNYSDDLNISIYDATMNLQREYTNFKLNKLDVSSLSQGIYILKIWNKDFIDEKLIIKN